MSQLLPDKPRLKIDTISLPLTGAKLEKFEHVMVFAAKSMPASAWKQVPHAETLKKLQRRNPMPDAIPAAHTRLDNRNLTGISLYQVVPGLSSFRRLELARRAVTVAMQGNPASIAVHTVGFVPSQRGLLIEAICAAALAAVSPMPSLKTRPKALPRLRKLTLIGKTLPDLVRLKAENEGNHLARWLTSQPPNSLNAESYRLRIAKLAESSGWKMTFFDVSALRKKNAGAFLAVAQAGDHKAGIVHLRYRPGAKTAKPDIALVGKGICFDTGGVNLKPARGMQNMHDDMQGSAVALGVLSALTTMKSKLAIDCWLAITENLISPEAYKPMDVVTSANGKTIEVIHTDAEGRMALADTLVLAAKHEPKVMIDYATLTGACVAAVTERYSGVFSNRANLNAVMTTAGADSGERVWPFPMDDDFDEGLLSPIADISQCRLDGNGDHIYAAKFLKNFVDDRPWIHVDLSSGRHKGGLAHIPTDVTGFGVRFTLNLIDQQDLLSHCD